MIRSLRALPSGIGSIQLAKVVTLKTKLVPLLALLVLLAIAPRAGAVWGGAVDTAHPQVGAMYFDLNGDGIVTADEGACSGSYVGRSKDGRADVFLTAGHCIPPADLRSMFPPEGFRVSFDGDATDGVTGAIQVTGYEQMPGFGHGSGDPRDLGLVFLPPGSAQGITPVELPPAHLLDDLKAGGQLKFLHPEIVGYGVTPVWNIPGPTFFVDGAVRHAGTSTVTGLTKSLLLFSQNLNGIGTGSGLCFGDSGSPQLLPGSLRVVSVTRGGNAQCNANDANYRVDTPAARDFLGEFLDLP
jgi:hypothetical protein